MKTLKHHDIMYWERRILMARVSNIPLSKEEQASFLSDMSYWAERCVKILMAALGIGALAIGITAIGLLLR